MNPRSPAPPPLPAGVEELEESGLELEGFEEDQDLEDEPRALEATSIEPPLRFEENEKTTIEPDPLAPERARLARERKALAGERAAIAKERALLEKKIAAFRAAAGAREAALARKEREVRETSRLFAFARVQPGVRPAAPPEPVRRIVSRRRTRRI